MVAACALTLPTPSAAITFSIDAIPGGLISTARDVALGEVFTVDVVVDSAPEGSVVFDGFSLGVVFDDTVLSAVSITPGPVAAGSLRPPPSIAVPVRLSGTFFLLPSFALDPQTLSGAGVLAEIVFQVIGDGSSTIGFTNTSLTSVLANPLAPTLPTTGGVNAARIDVAAAAVPAPIP